MERLPRRRTGVNYDEDASVRRHATLPRLRAGLPTLGICNDKYAEQSNANLKRAGYDTVLDLCQLCKASRSGVRRVSKYAFSDSRSDDEVARKAIMGAVAHMAEARAAQQSVLVHCEGGVNRASAVVAAWALATDSQLSRATLISHLRHEKTTQSGDPEWSAFVAPTHLHLFQLLDADYVARLRRLVDAVGGPPEGEEDQPRNKKRKAGGTKSTQERRSPRKARR